MFGVTDYSKLSSGMKQMLVALLYADTFPGYTINVSSCSTEYLEIICRAVAGKNIKLLINHRDISTIDVPLKHNGIIYDNGKDLLCKLENKVQLYKE